MGEGKGGKLRKFFLFAAIAGAIGAVVSYFKRRRGSFDDDEWQELPPPEGG
jgi:hypothetical protein